MAVAFADPSGSRAIDLVNTVDWRDDPERRVDLMPTATALAAWASHEGFAAADANGCRLPDCHRRAVALRETVATLLRAATRGRPLPPAELSELSRWNQEAWRHRVLTSRQATAAWHWSARTSGGDRTLFTIALDAAELLLSPDRRRIRVCEGGGCGWFFIDRSKAGRRRWCNMGVCGNRVKVRSYRQRVARV